MRIKKDEESSLSHSLYFKIWKVIYRKLWRDIGVYLRRLCDYKGVDIVEANAHSNRMRMLVKIPPKVSVSCFIG